MRGSHWLVATIACGVIGQAAAQTTIHVAICGDDSWSGLSDVCQAPDGPKATIQAAVDAASDGDTVLVHPGWSYRQFDLWGKALTIASTGGPGVTSLTHLGPCCDQRYVIYLNAADARVEGFTIENYDLGNWEYAAITMDNSHAAFVDCVFLDCVTDYVGQPGRGGAVFATGGSARFEDCQFLRCYAFGEQGGGYDGAFGGAVYADGVSLDFVGCRFEECSSRTGGAIYATAGSLRVDSCEFRLNQARMNHDTYDGGGGGAIATGGNIAEVTNSLFVGNSASISGGALGDADLVRGCTFIDNTCGVAAPFGTPSIVSAGTVEGCLFEGNTIREGFDAPGGIARGHIRSSTFTGNTAQDAYVCSPSSAVNIVVYGNTGTPVEAGKDVRYSNIEGGYPGEGNIDADPLFVDAANEDYRLAAGSPCIDAGDNTAVPSGHPDDLAGEPRFRNDPATPDTGVGIARVVDMGAYEYQPGPFCAADFNDDGTRNTQDVLAFLNAWNAGEPTADVNGDGIINTQDVLAFLNTWNAGC